MDIVNDPRITAYALGELCDEELRIFEQELHNAGGAERALHELRECITMIRDAFASEPVYTMSDEQRAVLLAEEEVAPVPLPLADGEFQHSDKILPWVTQPVISKMDTRKIAEALKPSPLRRALPLIGSLGVAAGVVWLAAIVLQHETPEAGGGGGLASLPGETGEMTIEYTTNLSKEEWLKRRAEGQLAEDLAGYRYGAPIPARPGGDDGVFTVAGQQYRDPSFEHQRNSRFPAVVGSGSYQLLRKFMVTSLIPPAGSLSVGELLNAFDYRFPAPAEGETFAVVAEVAPSPWAPDRQLVQIGVSAGGEQADTGGAPVAEDVQMAVEFNPAAVAGYRRIGESESKAAAAAIAASGADDVSAGHQVTALYEVVPREGDSDLEATLVGEGELGTVRVEYTRTAEAGKQPQSLEYAVPEVGATDWRRASSDLRFAASVAGYGMLLGGDENKPLATYDFVLELARDSLGDDPDGKRAEFVEWIEKTMEMKADDGE